MRSLYLTAAVALFAFGATAADYTPPSTSLKDAPSGVYEADTSHSSILFSYDHMGFSNPIARFKRFDAQLDFDAAQPEKSKVNVTIELNSVDSDADVMDAKFMSKELFDTKQFPQATFKSTKVSKLSDHIGKIYGDLTLHGVTKPVVLDVTLNGAGVHPMMKMPMLGFSARTTVNRSDFGLGFGVPMVGDKVTIAIETEFHKAEDKAAPARQ